MKFLPRALAHPQTACCLVSLAVGLALVTVPRVHAAGMYAPAPVPTPISASPQPQLADPAASYTPKPKETLDQVIEKTMPGSPLKMDLLRQAFFQHNPQAFVAGSHSKFKKGVSLKIPEHNQLLKGALQAREKTADAPAEQLSDTSSGNRDERRQWVRYP